MVQTQQDRTADKAKVFIDLAITKIDEFILTTKDSSRQPNYKVLGFAQADLTHAKHILDGGQQDAAQKR